MIMALRGCNITLVVLVVASALGTGVAVEAGVTPADACKDRKAKDTGLYALSLTKAFGRNGKVPNLARLASDLSSAQSKITRDFTRAEFTGSGVPRGCVTTGDVTAIQAKADSLAEDVIDEIDGAASTSTTTTPTTTTTTNPEPCASGAYPTCGGSCPPGEVCQAVTFISNAVAPHCACFPSSLPCPDGCGQPPGACPPGQLCVVNDTPVGDCGCVAPPWCLGTIWPTCGGNCPDGLCIAAPGGVCYCLG
jgi:hypothetical protein